MRYRGAIEYDKMILNILNFHNEVKGICEDEYIQGDHNQTIFNYINELDFVLNTFNQATSASYQQYEEKLSFLIGGKEIYD